MKNYILGLAVALVLMSGPAFATEKTKSELQTDLATNKRMEFNGLTMYSDMINMTDSFQPLADASDLSTSAALTTTNGGQVLYLSAGSASQTVILPASTGSDLPYSFVVATAPASNFTITIRVAGSTGDDFAGFLSALAADGIVYGSAATTTSDTIVFDSADIAVGNQIVFRDIVTGKYSIDGGVQMTSAGMISFSSAVDDQ